MRRIFFSVLLAAASIIATAAPVDRQKALLSARKILSDKKVREATLPLAVRKRFKAVSPTAAPAFYVFNADDGKGFAIVAGDDVFPEFVGYSDTGTFRENVELPCGLEAFLEFYIQYVTDVRAGRAEAPKHRAPMKRAPRASVAPLLNSSFGQDAPYNNLCLNADNVLCPCGCVATAVAQIMYYWRWPKVREGKIGYNWDVVMPSTEENLASADASEVIAQVCKDIGTAVQMSYAPTGSGAQSCRVVEAFGGRFGYTPYTLRHQWRICAADDEEWLNLIKTELIGGRPVYFSASSPIGGGRDSGGHAFVVDGYNESNFVHVNWGWDGAFNGDYDLVQLNPQAYSFVQDQTIITGVRPAYGTQTGQPQYFMQLRTPPEYTGATSIRTSLEFNIGVGDFYNFTSVSHTWQYTIGIFDTSLRLLGTIHTSRAIPSVTLGMYHYIPWENRMAIPCKLNAYGDGDYVLRVIFREQGSEEWQVPDMVGGQAKNMIPIRIANKKVQFNADVVITDIDRVWESAQADGNTRLTIYNLSGHVLYDGKPEGFSLSKMQGHGVVIVKNGNEIRKLAY